MKAYYCVSNVEKYLIFYEDMNFSWIIISYVEYYTWKDKQVNVFMRQINSVAGGWQFLVRDVPSG
jgi:hypothetical protein